MQADSAFAVLIGTFLGPQVRPLPASLLGKTMIPKKPSPVFGPGMIILP